MGQRLKGLAKPSHRAEPVSAELARRVGAFVFAVGEREAIRRLKIGKPTLAAAREHGAMLRSTRERLEEALLVVELEEAASRLGEVGT